MVKFLRSILATVLISSVGIAANAQYYEIANQLPSLISPALSGSLKYKGSVDAGYVGGIGQYNADFLSISTSQGFQYASWFYMGVGLGVDFLFSHKADQWGEGWEPHDRNDFDYNHSSSCSGVMVPIFTDFRFNIGSDPSSTSFFIDLKVGCSFLMGKDYIEINNGYLTNQQYFYLRPNIGIRIPVSSSNPRQAFNVGVSYQLLTSNYWNSWNRNVTLNAIGATIGFEW